MHARVLTPVLLAAFVLVASAGALAALPVECVPACEMTSVTAAFAQPVTVISSGASVTWSAIDEAHTATAVGEKSKCFHKAYSPGVPGSIRFFIEDGALKTQDGNALPKTCASAAPLDNGGFSVEYYCIYHAQMKAVLVVNP